MTLQVTATFVLEWFFMQVSMMVQVHLSVSCELSTFSHCDNHSHDHHLATSVES